MKSQTVFSGNFATGEGQLGNYSAYPEDGVRLHIPKKLMENNGWTKNEEVKFPFFVLVNEREIDTRDEEGNLTGVLVKRKQVTAIFTDINKLVEAKTASKRVDILCAQSLKSAVETAGLTVDELRSLTTTSI